MDTLDCIRTRRSVRQYSSTKIDEHTVEEIIKAAICAPSGKNGQPWRFKIVSDKTLIDSLSKLSIYGSWLRKASCFIAVFLDKECSYNYKKDVQSCGAAIQNMLLAAHNLGIGSCWIGEILKEETRVKALLQINRNELELMSIIALGYSQKERQLSERNIYQTFLL